jgi:hypothetical protein
MSLHRVVAFGYFVFLLGASAINYIPGLTDEEGVAFGVFALDIGDDALHLASALWALVAAITSKQAARIFLGLFGALYLGDGLMGLALGSGYLDLGIFRWGVQDLDFGFKIMANAPHILLGGFAVLVALIRP